ncbi:alanine--glyoxylate aminotransferase family protein [bacterium]|nr:alanine--glyoxylate aminotransferase family protein [bacterium]
MKKLHLFTPGPTMVPGDVALAGAKDMVHHRTDQFYDIYEECAVKLQTIFETKLRVLTLNSTGSGAMEAAVSNLVSPGETMITFNGGKFGERWTKIGKSYRCNVHEVKYEWSDASTPDKLEQALKDAPGAIGVFTQLSETSSGVLNPIKDLTEIAHAAGKLIIVDAISGLLAHPCPMDDWDLDVLISGSQKGFMMPPGVAFVVLGPRAVEKMEKTDRTGFYFDLVAAIKNDAKRTHPWTSNVSLFQQLNVALDMLLEEGLPNIHKRHEIQGEAVRAATDALGFKRLSEKFPSNVLTPVLMPEGIDSTKVTKFMRDEWGIFMAAGQDDYKTKIIRIGTIGYQDYFDTIMGLAAFEMGMKKFGAPVELGVGVKAAQEVFMSHLC